MNRRNFFRALAAVGAIVAAPALLLRKSLPGPRHWDVTFTTRDMAMSLNDFERLVLEPARRKAAKDMAEAVDRHVLEAPCRTTH
jgi:hypothetical protein